MGKIINDLSLKDVLEYRASVCDPEFGSYDIRFQQPFEGELPVKRMEKFYRLVISDINKGVIPSEGHISHVSVAGFEGFGALPMRVLKEKADQEGWLKNLLESYEKTESFCRGERSPARVNLSFYDHFFGEVLTFCTIPELYGKKESAFGACTNHDYYKKWNGPIVHFYNSPYMEDDRRTMENVGGALRHLLKDSTLDLVVPQILRESREAISKLKSVSRSSSSSTSTSILDYQI